MPHIFERGGYDANHPDEQHPGTPHPTNNGDTDMTDNVAKRKYAEQGYIYWRSVLSSREEPQSQALRREYPANLRLFADKLKQLDDEEKANKKRK